jgi:hypothetical protein
MKKYQNYLFICLAAVAGLAITTNAPAQPTSPDLSSPRAKTGPTIPLDRAITGPRLTGRLPSPLMPTEACLFDDSYATGATNAGTTFCTRQTGFQVLPPERQGKISAVNVPVGYILTIFSQPNGTGNSCRLVEDHAGIEPPCDNMARSITLARGTAQQIAAVKVEQTNRQIGATNSDEFAPGRKAIQEAAARQAAAEALQRTNITNAGPCPVELLSTDGPNPNRRCVGIGQSIAYVGDNWNDDIERVRVNSPYAQMIGYEHANFTGRRIHLMCGDWELIGDPENEISSVRVEYVSLGDEIFCNPGKQEMRRWGY